MRENHALFLQLLAAVFAQFGLIPPTFPGLQDPKQLSLFGILGCAWRALRFDRDGLPKVLMFFSILGMMILSLIAAAGAILSLLVGTAHAAPATDSAFFAPASQDVAQAWIDYLFNGVALPNYYNQMGQAIPSNLGLQQAFTTVLGFYSSALLIVAGVVLFYHLAAMVAETAHHGVPMGKRASQIWAPIRLVVAIGLLVPVGAAGLNCGQYIVIQVAELGSGMASTAWATFLDALANYAPASIPPASPVVTQIAADLIASEACVYDFNTRIDAFAAQGLNMSGSKIPTTPTAIPNQTIGGHVGTKYSFSSNDLSGQDICGWYFLPTVPSGADAATTAAYRAQANALNAALPNFTTDGQTIKIIMPQSAGGLGGTTPLTLDPTSLNDVIAYQTSLANNMSSLGNSVQSQTAAAVQQLTPYGWVFAGALMPMVARVEGMVSNAVTEGMPVTHPPDLVAPADAPSAAYFASWRGLPTQQKLDSEWQVGKQVADDLKNFGVYLSKSWAQKQATNTQCAAMLGLQDEAQGSGGSIVNFIFGKIDTEAERSGVWTSGSAPSCGGTGTAPPTFRVGINQINGGDPLAEIARLGHANIDSAFTLLAWSLAGKLGGAGGAIIGAAFGTTAEPGLGSVAGMVAGYGIATALSAVTGLLDFVATIFLACGFVLAFVLPMFPFTRFFFAVLSWLGSVVEAVIAMPLVALAHLNPEGEGLPGQQAKQAYFFIFSLFLRPILSVFGLVAGLLMFLIAVSFLTYTYNLAVAASGGTAYGHAAMAKIVYSVLYVAMLYICANHSFAMIDHIPKHAMSWMGASGPSAPELGNAQHMAQFESLVGTYAGQQVLSTMSKAGGNIADGARDMGKGGVDQWRRGKQFRADKETRETAAGLSEERHKEMIGAIKGGQTTFTGAERPSPQNEEGSPTLGAGDRPSPDDAGPPPSGDGSPPIRSV